MALSSGGLPWVILERNNKLRFSGVRYKPRMASDAAPLAVPGSRGRIPAGTARSWDGCWQKPVKEEVGFGYWVWNMRTDRCDTENWRLMGQCRFMKNMWETTQQHRGTPARRSTVSCLTPATTGWATRSREMQGSSTRGKQHRTSTRQPHERRRKQHQWRILKSNMVRQGAEADKSMQG